MGHLNFILCNHFEAELFPSIDCEACGGQIGGARIFCLDCTSDDTWDSVDLCDNETCLKAEIRRSHLPRPHRPTHDFVKVRRVVHLPYIGQLERSARAALTKSRNIFALPMNNGISIGKGAPVCIFCNTQVNQPCWYCIQCGGAYHLIIYYTLFRSNMAFYRSFLHLQRM